MQRLIRVWSAVVFGALVFCAVLGSPVAALAQTAEAWLGFSWLSEPERMAFSLTYLTPQATLAAAVGSSTSERSDDHIGSYWHVVAMLPVWDLGTEEEPSCALAASLGVYRDKFLTDGKPRGGMGFVVGPFSTSGRVWQLWAWWARVSHGDSLAGATFDLFRW
jgi:hypothetical protein